MTLNDLLAIIPEAERDRPLCVLDPRSGFSFEVRLAEVDDDEYISTSPPPPCNMSEATCDGRHVLLRWDWIK